MRYEELVARNRAAYEQRKKKERQAALIKYSKYAVMLAVCGTASYIVWNKYEARKERESALAAEEARRIEEAAYRKAEEQRLAAEEAQRKRTEERLAQQRKLEEERWAREKKQAEERLAWERKLEEERLAREKARQEREDERLARVKQREEERLAWERKLEEERLAREKARQEREEKMADDRRRQEEERKASEQSELAAERKRQEKKRVKDSKYQLDFFAAQRDIGGSVLEPLVRKLNNNIDDKDMFNTSSRNARAVALSKISGSIGPVYYSQRITTKKITSTQAIGGFDGHMNGGLVSGTVYGPVTSVKEKVGGYVANVPAGFKKGFENLMSVARRGHSRANAEAGACIFVDAAKGQIGIDDRTALTMFTKAADLGDSDAMYMQAFCLFYGIGRMSNNEKDVREAYRILTKWKSQPGAQSLRDSGWAHRRLKEARQLGY